MSSDTDSFDYFVHEVSAWFQALWERLVLREREGSLGEQTLACLARQRGCPPERLLHVCYRGGEPGWRAVLDVLVQRGGLREGEDTETLLESVFFLAIPRLLERDRALVERTLTRRNLVRLWAAKPGWLDGATMHEALVRFALECSDRGEWLALTTQVGLFAKHEMEGHTGYEFPPGVRLTGKYPWEYDEMERYATTRYRYLGTHIRMRNKETLEALLRLVVDLARPQDLAVMDALLAVLRASRAQLDAERIEHDFDGGTAAMLILSDAFPEVERVVTEAKAKLSAVLAACSASTTPAAPAPTL